MIKSVLIANRGEIACRIIRTAHRLGIRTIAVYSEVDATSLAVLMADGAYAIGPPPSSESYLNIPKILEVAKMADVETIHPGYGFLSENESFAQACDEAGFVFIGPSLEALRKMGSKSEAKMIAKKAGIPVIPGYAGDQNHLSDQADRLGYPVMIKAVMGGGGKGMRRVDTKKDFQKALKACQLEAISSFGKRDVLLEKYIPTSRHIEVQIFGDTQGNLIHLFERDCSLQRRSQKVIEETPSSLFPDVKEKLYAAALKLGQSIHYVGAGTVEFLVDQDGNYYFMEMNTRLQVEHPVTEAITGLDLVEWQFRIASRERLPRSQKEIISHGHALEMRLYAEDPHHNFKPMTGKVWMKEAPQNVRIDTGLHPIDTITPYYDPLLAKLIVAAETRSEALQKASLALEQWKILGLKTNASFLKKLVNNPAILKNRFDVGFIDRHLKTLAPTEKTPEEVYVAASLTKVLSQHQNTVTPWDEKHNWRLDGYAPLSFTWTSEEDVRTISLTYSPQGWVYAPWGTIVAHLFENTLFLFGTQIPYWARGEKIFFSYQGESYSLAEYIPVLREPTKGKGDSHLKAPMTGKVSEVFVKEGDRVKESQPLLALEAMKLEHIITSPRKGKIKRIFYHVGDVVEEGIVTIDLGEEENRSHELSKAR